MKLLWYILGAIVLILLLKTTGMLDRLKTIFERFEGFSAKPYWDVSRWSWGYGTQAPNPETNPSARITKSQALTDSLAFINDQRNTLAPKITVPMNDNKWAALLSFGYNEGIGAALKLLPNINSGNKEALKNQWLSYNKVRNDKGILVFNEGLSRRRMYEFNLWST